MSVSLERAPPSNKRSLFENPNLSAPGAHGSKYGNSNVH